MRDSNPGSSALEADAVTTRPTRRSEEEEEEEEEEEVISARIVLGQVRPGTSAWKRD